MQWAPQLETAVPSENTAGDSSRADNSWNIAQHKGGTAIGDALLSVPDRSGGRSGASERGALSRGGARVEGAEQQADKASAAGTSGAPLGRAAPGLELARSAGETRSERQRRFKGMNKAAADSFMAGMTAERRVLILFSGPKNRPMGFEHQSVRRDRFEV